MPVRAQITETVPRKPPLCPYLLDSLSGAMPGMDVAATRTWVDDGNAIFRRGLVSCLDGNGFVVAGQSSNLRPEPDLAKVDILLFDVEGSGFRPALELARGTSARLVGLSSSPDEEKVLEVVAAGLAGLLIRAELTPERLLSTLRLVASGSGPLPPDLLARLCARLAGEERRGALAGRLGRRELAVLRLLAEGGSTRDIAGQLCYSERTVKNIVHDALTKMNCRTRTQAVALATRQGVI
jgi:DNA-binding NarL/FixJ family response regulator